MDMADFLIKKAIQDGMVAANVTIQAAEKTNTSISGARVIFAAGLSNADKEKFLNQKCLEAVQALKAKSPLFKTSSIAREAIERVLRDLGAEIAKIDEAARMGVVSARFARRRGGDGVSQLFQGRRA